MGEMDMSMMSPEKNDQMVKTALKDLKDNFPNIENQIEQTT
jgi:hypothetical protein